MNYSSKKNDKWLVILIVLIVLGIIIYLYNKQEGTFEGFSNRKQIINEMRTIWNERQKLYTDYLTQKVDKNPDKEYEAKLKLRENQILLENNFKKYYNGDHKNLIATLYALYIGIYTNLFGSFITADPNDYDSIRDSIEDINSQFAEFLNKINKKFDKKIAEWKIKAFTNALIGEAFAIKYKQKDEFNKSITNAQQKINNFYNYVATNINGN